MRYAFVIASVASLVGRPAFGQVEIPEGFEIVEFAFSDTSTWPPAINNCGQIAFGKRLGRSQRTVEILLYDNGRITQVTDNRYRDIGVDINDAGSMVWQRTVRGEPTERRQIILYADGVETILKARRKVLYKAFINNLGHVAWTQDRSGNRCPLQSEVFFWDGESIRQITENRDFSDQWPRLNDLDDIAWMHSDFCVNPWVGDIRLYSEGEIIVLPSEYTQAVEPSINNARQVAWHGEVGIELWQEGETVFLIDWGHVAVLNNLGDMYFSRYDPIRDENSPWLYRVSDGEPHFYPLMDEFRHLRGDINDWVEVVWLWTDEPMNPDRGGYRFLRRIRTGDSEFDGDIDLIDYAGFAGCMTGPGLADGLCDCRFLDIDYDGDVDLGDFALFQNAFGAK